MHVIWNISRLAIGVVKYRPERTCSDPWWRHLLPATLFPIFQPMKWKSLRASSIFQLFKLPKYQSNSIAMKWNLTLVGRKRQQKF